MRLWHEQLINKLPRQQLLGQHRECCALRGKGWNKNHSTVDYIFDHDIEKLIAYHFKAMDEMILRGYNPNLKWYIPEYRGKTLGYADEPKHPNKYLAEKTYDEHDENYLRECVDNLKAKGCVCRFVEEKMQL